MRCASTGGIASARVDRSDGAEWLRTFEESKLPMSADVLVRVLHALIEELVLQRILSPELCTDEVFFEAFAALTPERG